MTDAMLIPERTVSKVLDQCLGVSKGEEVVLLTDEGTDTRVIEALRRGVEAREGSCLVVSMQRFARPGSEPPAPIAFLLEASDAAIELTSTFIGSSQARQRATLSGTRYLAMPAIEADTFRIGGPLDVDFDALRPTTEAIAQAWEEATMYRFRTSAGTDLSGSVAGRKGRSLHGIARSWGAYMAPPDIESGTAPLEGTSNGVVIVDGDFLFMGRGPLSGQVALHFEHGNLVAIEGDEGHRLREMMDICADPLMTNLAEISVGLNPNGRVCGVPMETESTLGSGHIALGNSIAYGGTVAAIAHLDCVFRDVLLELDDRPILDKGRLVT
jgi:leucyl aminopeptidase (aminopeptidase T)